MTELDKYADKPKVEVNRDLVEQLRVAQNAVARWTEELVRLKTLVQKEMGDAYVATVEGEAAFTYMPKQSYRTADLRRDYPNLVEHYMEVRVEHEFNVDKFAAAHPDIAAQYQVREFRRAT